MPEIIFLEGRGKLHGPGRGQTSGRTNTETHFRAVLLTGNHALPKPIRVVVSFEEPISELGQILSQFDDMQINFWAPATRGPSLAFYFVFFRQGFRKLKK